MILTPQKLWPSAILITLLLVLANPAWAFSLPDLLKPVEELIQQTPLAQIIPGNQQLTISSTITLAHDGDINKNGEIDAGDTITFTYTIQNRTDQKYAFATLKTNIDRKLINYIHNVRGSTGILEIDNTVSIPNFRIGSNEQSVISFDAIINYYQEDKVITTEPEFISFEKKSLAKSLRKEIKAKKLSAEEVYKRGFSINKGQ